MWISSRYIITSYCRPKATTGEIVSIFKKFETVRIVLEGLEFLTTVSRTTDITFYFLGLL
jgi:hypothetical protein